MPGGPTERSKLSQAKQEVLARLLRGESVRAGIPRRSSGGPAPLSHAQQRLWLLWQLHPESSHYNVPGILRFEGELDPAALERALGEIVRRHEVLRTMCALVDGQPAQVVAEIPRFVLPLEDLSASPDPEGEVRRRAVAMHHRPFDLSAPPLLRAALYRLSARSHILNLVFHHIVIDGWSMRVLNRELTALYTAFLQGKASPLPELQLQYADYACWERGRRAEIEPQLRYWKRKLSGVAPLQLPIDRPRAGLSDFRGGMHSFELSASLTRALKSLAVAEESTLFMVLLAGFNALLHRYTGQEDVVVGTPTAQRTRTELEDLIGFFANTLVLRTGLHGELSFRDLLKRVRETCRGAYAHQEIAFDLLVDELQPERWANRNPIFQVAFALQERFGDERGELRLPDLVVTPVLLEADETRLDLELHLTEIAGVVRGNAIYSTALFEALTIEQMMTRLARLLEDAVADPGRSVSRLSLLDDVDRAQFTGALRSRGPRPSHATLGQAFEAQVERAPDAVALVSGGRSWTYLDLDRLAGRFAASLQTAGAGPGSLVAVLLPPAPEGVIACLGALEAGACFLLLDPSAPEAHTASLLRGVRPFACVVERGRGGPACVAEARVLHVDAEPAAEDAVRRVRGAEPAPGQPAYAARSTSGHLVAIDHGALVARCEALQELSPLSTEDVVLLHAPPELDAAVWEMLWPLSFGARLVLASAAERGSVADLQRLAARERVSVVRLTAPTLLRWFHDAPPDAPDLPLRAVIVQGGQLDPRAVEGLFARSRAALLSTTGVVEAAAVLIAHRCEPGHAPPVIPRGDPCAGSALLVLDALQQPVPPGIDGEIYAGGAGLAQGYLGAPGASARSFVESPFPERCPGSVFRTGLRGRWLPGGELQVEEDPRSGHIEDRRVDLRDIEHALLEDASVEDCAAIVRCTLQGDLEIVAHVVARGAFNERALREAMAARLPPALRPHAYALVLRIPLTAIGDVDAEALLRAPILDDALLETCERLLEASPAVKESAVARVQEFVEEPPLHAWDLIPRELRHRAAERPDGEVVTPASSTAAPRPRGTPALVQGPALPEDLVPRSLVETLERAARGPEPGIVTCIQAADGSGVRQSYAELLEEAKRIAAGLRARGRKPQDRVLLQLESGHDFIQALWGCVLSGVVVVPLAVPSSYTDDGGGVGKLLNAWKLLDGPAILTTRANAPQLHALAKRSEQPLSVEILEELRAHPATPEPWRPSPEDVALMLLTSGSTSLPKAVMLSHRNILCRSAATAQSNGFTRKDVSLNWMLLDHVGGVVMFHLRDTYLGCDQIHVPIHLILEDPLRWLDWIDRHRVTITWAPNFAYGLVNDRATAMAGRHWDLSSLGFILNAGEAVIGKTARRFLDLLRPYGLPRTAMRPAWGMTETSSAVVFAELRPDDAGEDGASVEVGGPIPGTSFRVVDRDNGLVDEGTIGRLQVKGQSVTAGYYRNPDENRRAFTDDGWFITGDLGFLRQGRLTITGREKDDIIVNGVNYLAHEIEAATEEVDGIESSYAAAFAVGDRASNTESLAIAFHTPWPEARWPALAAAVRERTQRRLGVSARYLLPLPKSAIPKTGIGKIQRSALKRQFEVGELDAIVKQMDRVMGASTLIPSWFYRRTWRPKALRWRWTDLEPDQRCVLLMDEHGLGAATAERLERAGARCVKVVAGDRFERIDAQSYRLRPAAPKHYELLADALAQDGIAIGAVAHLFTYGERLDPSSGGELLQAQERGLLSVHALARALAALQRRSTRLCVITSHVQGAGDDDEVGFANGALPGLVQTLRREHPALRCSLIDLPPAEAATNPDRLIGELFSEGSDVEIAYRRALRLIPALERLDWRGGDPAPLPLRRGGLFLLSGGLGGIGFELARCLIDTWAARLLILGRTELPHRSSWAERAAVRDPLGKQLERLLELERRGGEIAYEAVDVCDAERVAAAVRAAEARWGRPCDGAFHLAGTLTERPLSHETPATLLEAIRAKVIGAWSIHQVIAERPEALVVHFSSVNGFFGGSRVGAYAAASSFLDSFSRYERTRRGRKSRCLSWSMWEDTGMAASYKLKELTRASGYHILTPQHGIQCVLAALARDDDQLMIGLDGSKPGIYRLEGGPPRERSSLVAFIIPMEAGAEVSLPPEMPTADRFGTEIAWTVLATPGLPRREDGAVDRDELSRRGSGAGARPAERQFARNDLERHVAAVWKSALGVSELDINDNVFSLGANSLLVAQVMFKLRDSLGVDLPPATIFKVPTVAGTAEAIASHGFAVSTDLRAEAHLDLELVPEGVPQVDPRPVPQAVLLTGASGFLGAFLLHEFLRQTQAEVFCLVRAGSEEEGQRRLRDNLRAYQLWEDSFERRVTVVPGDLEKPRLGLGGPRYDELAARIDLIVHNGALVNMTYPYLALRGSNVQGTKELLALAVRGKVKPFHFISTVAILGAASRSDLLREDDPLENNDRLRLGYVQSKWVAEKLIVTAGARGLPVAIYRPGRISGDTTHGACQTKDFFWRLIKACVDLGAVPDLSAPESLGPVDFVARAIVRIALHEGATGKAYHLLNPESIAFDDFKNWMVEMGYTLETLPYDQWRDRLLRRAAEDSETSGYSLSSLFPAHKSASVKRPPYDARNTEAALRGSGLSWPRVNRALVELYFRYFQAKGFLPGPPTSPSSSAASSRRSGPRA